MTQEENEKFNPESMLQAWMKSAMDFWSQAAAGYAAKIEPEKSEPGFQSRAGNYWKSANQTWQALARYFSEPETMKTMAEGVNVSPQAELKAAESMWQGFFSLQQQFLERAAGLASHTEAYKFDEINQDTFKAWAETYEKELRAFINIPSLGLGRFYQERAARVLDQFNIFQNTLAEFLYYTYLPMEKSWQVIQHQIGEAADQGQPPQEFKDIYNKWIKTLEGHYMVLFKSPEYMESLANTLSTFEDFSTARHKWLEDIIRTLPVPTQHDMDETYREIYLLKKEVKKLKKKLKEK